MWPSLINVQQESWVMRSFACYRQLFIRNDTILWSFMTPASCLPSESHLEKNLYLETRPNWLLFIIDFRQPLVTDWLVTSLPTIPTFSEVLGWITGTTFFLKTHSCSLLLWQRHCVFFVSLNSFYCCWLFYWHIISQTINRDTSAINIFQKVYARLCKYFFSLKGK